MSKRLLIVYTMALIFYNPTPKLENSQYKWEAHESRSQCATRSHRDRCWRLALQAVCVWQQGPLSHPECQQAIDSGHLTTIGNHTYHIYHQGLSPMDESNIVFRVIIWLMNIYVNTICWIVIRHVFAERPAENVIWGIFIVNPFIP